MEKKGRTYECMITEKGIDLISQMSIKAARAEKSMVENVLDSDMNTDAKFYHIGRIIFNMVSEISDIQERIFEEELGEISDK